MISMGRDPAIDNNLLSSIYDKLSKYLDQASAFAGQRITLRRYINL